jgi:hypothetical protein
VDDSDSELQALSDAKRQLSEVLFATPTKSNLLSISSTRPTMRSFANAKN